MTLEIILKAFILALALFLFTNVPFLRTNLSPSSDDVYITYLSESSGVGSGIVSQSSFVQTHT